MTTPADSNCLVLCKLNSTESPQVLVVYPEFSWRISNFGQCTPVYMCKCVPMLGLFTSHLCIKAIAYSCLMGHQSSSAYDTLCKSHIHIPSQRSLRDYTHAVQPSVGFSNEVERQLLEAACIATHPEHEKNMIVTMDEMHIKEDFLFQKHTGPWLDFATWAISTSIFRSSSKAWSP